MESDPKKGRCEAKKPPIPSTRDEEPHEFKGSERKYFVGRAKV
jgi:hypothetical protein